MNEISIRNLSSKKLIKGHMTANKLEPHIVPITIKLFRSSDWPVWLNDWVFVYKLNGYDFESRCNHLNFRYRACFEQGVPLHDKNTQSYSISFVCPSTVQGNFVSNRPSWHLHVQRIKTLQQSVKYVQSYQ